MIKGITVKVSKGHTIPDAYLQLVLKDANAFGGAVVDGNGIEYNVTSDPSEVNLEFVKTQFLEPTKDTLRMAYFGVFPKGFLEDDRQPHVLLEVDKKPVVMGFLNGAFMQPAKDGGKHEGTFFAANTFLRPKLKQIYDLAGLEKLYRFIKEDQLFRQEVEALYTGDGYVKFLTALGDVVSFDRTPIGAGYSWGQTTDALGYKEAGSVVAAAAKVVGGFLPGRKASATPTPTPAPAVAPTPAPATEEQPDDPPFDTKPEETPGTVQAEAEWETVEIAIPPSLSGKNRRRWIKNNNTNGVLPTNHDQLKVITVRRKKEIKSLKDIPARAADTPAAAIVDKRKPVTAARPVASVTPIPQAAPAAAVDESAIISADDKKLMEAWIEDEETVKKLDTHSKVIGDPNAWKKYLDKYPSYTDQSPAAPTGKITDVLRWPREMFEEHVNNFAPEAQVALMYELAVRLRIAYGEVTQAKKSDQPTVAAAAPQQPKPKTAFMPGRKAAM